MVKPLPPVGDFVEVDYFPADDCIEADWRVVPEDNNGNN